MNINKPLIVFGRNEIETYELLNAIAIRRAAEQAKSLRKQRIKAFFLDALCRIQKSFYSFRYR